MMYNIRSDYIPKGKRNMNKFFKAACAAVSCAAVISCAAFSVSAEDAVLDIQPVTSSGSWGQSVIYKTTLQTAENDFNPTAMTEDSVVKVEYTCDAPKDTCPVELIWQSWGEHSDDKIVDWAKVAPAEVGDGWADFNYDDIVAAYGTDDFSEVYNICVGDTGTPVTVTKITVTNLGEPKTLPAWAEELATLEETEAEVTEAETEAETEAVTEETTAETVEETEAETTVTEAETTVEETTAETTAKTTDATEAAEAVSVNNSGIDAAGVILIAAIAIVAAAIVFLVILIHQRGGFKK